MGFSKLLIICKYYKRINCYSKLVSELIAAWFIHEKYLLDEDLSEAYE